MHYLLAVLVALAVAAASYFLTPPILNALAKMTLSVPGLKPINPAALIVAILIGIIAYRIGVSYFRKSLGRSK